MLVAALKGNRARGSHPALPLTPSVLAADGVSCVRAGATTLHIHPRSAGSGLETLDPAVVDETVVTVRAATGVPVGVSTGAWIQPDPARRADVVSLWREPDTASVNFSEDGAELVAEALLDAGVGVEAGIWSVADAERLAVSGFSDRIARTLVEIVHPTEDPVGAAKEIEDALERLGILAPYLSMVSKPLRGRCYTMVFSADSTSASASRTASTSLTARWRLQMPSWSKLRVDQPGEIGQ